MTAAPARRGTRGRGESRLLNAAVGIVLLGAAVGVQSLDMTYNEYKAPLTYIGGQGEDVYAGRFTVRLKSVTVAKAVEHAEKTVRTDHLFLIADLSAKSKHKPHRLGSATLLTEDGRKFSATDRIDNGATITSKWVQPDIWVSGRYFFEVPPSALPGARLIVGMQAKALVEPYEPEVELDLGMDEATADKLVKSPQDVYSTAARK